MIGSKRALLVLPTKLWRDLSRHYQNTKILLVFLSNTKTLSLVIAFENSRYELFGKNIHVTRRIRKFDHEVLPCCTPLIRSVPDPDAKIELDCRAYYIQSIGASPTPCSRWFWTDRTLDRSAKWTTRVVQVIVTQTGRQERFGSES